MDCFNESRSAPDFDGESIGPLSGDCHRLLVSFRFELSMLYDAVRRVQQIHSVGLHLRLQRRRNVSGYILSIPKNRKIKKDVWQCKKKSSLAAWARNLSERYTECMVVSASASENVRQWTTGTKNIRALSTSAKVWPRLRQTPSERDFGAVSPIVGERKSTAPHCSQKKNPATGRAE